MVRRTRPCRLPQEETVRPRPDDRCCAYFSSSVLAAAARGFGRLIQRLEAWGERAPRPAVRLLVNEELDEADVRAMVERGDLLKLESRLRKRFKTPTEALEKRRLEMLGWLVKKGLLVVRVGVMRRGEGILHAKFGVLADETGDAVVFAGSGNESAPGFLSNYKQLEVSNSWEDPQRFQSYSQEFDSLWSDRHPVVHTVDLPEALRLKLVRFAPRKPPTLEPSTALARQKAAMIWQFITEAPYLPEGGPACDATAMVEAWPHQRRVVEETAAAWPEGRLLCDEVGMGKTIEAILILRRLLAGRGVERALILVPAGLLRQWQEELREKGGLVLPRLEGTGALVWPDETTLRVPTLSEALQQDILLMSRETARTENNARAVLEAGPWDLVILDESHAARLERVRALAGRDTKRDQFFEVLRRFSEEGRASLVFTGYTDTMEYLRDELVAHYGKALGCYSGGGGQLWDGSSWKAVGKDQVVEALSEERLRVLVCTDAASEGLNLQAASAVINYDLPWNPSKVEQRIGRIDRIGQRMSEVRVVNLFLNDSVDQQVYKALRSRCGLFEHFVGPMQPVLARARRMVMGFETVDLAALRVTADEVERDEVVTGTYLESEAAAAPAAHAAPGTRNDLEEALRLLTGEFGPSVREKAGRFTLSWPGHLRKAVLSTRLRTVEGDVKVLPASPPEPLLGELARALARPGERLPLVVGSHRAGAFRCSVVVWVEESGAVPVRSMAELKERLGRWDGRPPDPRAWVEAERDARLGAREHVEEMRRRAEERQGESAERQRLAARVRLVRELGRYLVCLGADPGDLNPALHEHMTRDLSGARRLKEVLDRLGGYPEWPEPLVQELRGFGGTVTESRRKGRLLMGELTAALEDPRWAGGWTESSGSRGASQPGTP